MEGFAQLRGNMMKPNSSCLHPQYLSPFINSCTLNRDTVCHPVSFQFSEGEGVNIVKTLEFSETEVLC